MCSSDLIAGTTRDAVDTHLTVDGQHFLLIDTAGIRRKGKTTEMAEKLSVVMISHHNLAFFLDTMRRVRQAIKLGEFLAFKKEFLGKLKLEEAASV